MQSANGAEACDWPQQGRAAGGTLKLRLQRTLRGGTAVAIERDTRPRPVACGSMQLHSLGGRPSQHHSHAAGGARHSTSDER